MTSHTAALPRHLVDPAVTAALAEDLGLAGDLTSQATLPADATARAVLSARDAGVIAGLDLAEAAFRLAGGDVTFTSRVRDGDTVTRGTVVAEVHGNARTLLAGERTALNFLNPLSGIATLTARFVEAVAGTGARICDTRKTMPGLRAFQKYAVRCGGGANHRFALNDAILIKDNHIAVAGGVGAAYRSALGYAGHLVAIEIEVGTLDELREAIEAGAVRIMLDNMGPDLLRQAVDIADGRAILEASGRVTLDTVRAIAETGVNYISSSQLTLAAPPLDLGLDIEVDT